MLSYLRGKIKSKSEDYVVLEVLGIGFKVFCSKKVLADLPLEKETELLIYLYKTQTVLDLYGFTTKEEKDFFEVLVDLPSIGPKAALIILSAGPVEKIKEAISAGNEKYFENVPGIGKKRVQKVILELSGKLNKEAVKKSETNGEEKNNPPASPFKKGGMRGIKEKKIFTF